MASGIAMSATRIVGAPVSFFPVLSQASIALGRSKKINLKALSRSMLISIIASIGTLGFLAYCQFRFGRYDLYMETQRIGWGIMPDYKAIFKWKEFAYASPIDQFSTIASGIAFLVFAAIEIGTGAVRKNRGVFERLPIYLVSALIFFITLSGLKSLNFRSMIRYTLPWHVLLLLCLAHLLSRNCRLSPAYVRVSAFLCAIGAGFAIWIYDAPHIIDFLNGRWFA
jgi:hypothetical protein